ncbi:MAG: hypothetical protein WA667_19660 [Candidatus Nitrosopolaris sp.]
MAEANNGARKELAQMPLYGKVKDEGHFSKIINYIAEICQYTEAENMNELLREYHASNFALNKSDRKTILQLWV